MTNISRRDALATTGRAAVAVLAGGGIAYSAMASESPVRPNADAELRRLWAEYQEREAANMTASAALAADRDELERSLFDGKTVEEVLRDRQLTDAERDHWTEELDAHPHTLWEATNETTKALIKTVRVIRATPAEGLLGIAVKLAVMPRGWNSEDMEDSAVSALGEINRMLGTEFSINGRTHFEEYGAWPIDDEDGADGDPNV